MKVFRLTQINSIENVISVYFLSLFLLYMLNVSENLVQK